MIIHEPQLRQSGKETTVEAAVEVERSDGEYPATLWFTFPETVGTFVTNRADGFAVALLPLAMRLGERLTVHGDLSYRLAHGLRDYQRFQSTWKPDFFTPSSCNATSCAAATRATLRARSEARSPGASTPSTPSGPTSSGTSRTLRTGSRTA